MQRFLMIIGKNRLNIYVKKGEHFDKKYFDGDPEFRYDHNASKKDVDKLCELLVKQFSLSTPAELEFDIIENEDAVYTNAITKHLQYIASRKAVEDFMKEIIQKLSRDQNLLIKDFGVNFDGKNYELKSGSIKKRDFFLLGYTIEEDDFVKFIE